MTALPSGSCQFPVSFDHLIGAPGQRQRHAAEMADHGIAGCCASVASGCNAAATISPATNPRRRIAPSGSGPRQNSGRNKQVSNQETARRGMGGSRVPGRTAVDPISRRHR